jgi:hypothetical protein
MSDQPELKPHLDHHLAELHQVADELRAARQAADTRRRQRRPGPGTIRMALGRAFLAVAGALLAEPTSTRLAAR